jgi:hypothetical protein
MFPPEQNVTDTRGNALDGGFGSVLVQFEAVMPEIRNPDHERLVLSAAP